MASKQNMAKNASRRLCLKRVPKDMTKRNVVDALLADFPNIKVFMPKNTHNKNVKLVFVDFQRTWEAKVAKRLINLMNFSNIAADYCNLPTTKPDFSMQELIMRRATDVGDQMPETGDCTYCRSPQASKVCQNCVTPYSCYFYCSKDHQTRDWPEHKIECKSLPELINSTEVTRDSPPQSESKPNFVMPHVPCFQQGDFVVMTHFERGRNLYVRSVRENFDELMREIEKSVESSPTLSDIPEQDIYVLAWSKGIYRRAKVRDHIEADENGNDLDCNLVDFGYNAVVSSKNLKKMKYKIRALPRQTFKVILEGVNTKHNRLTQTYLEKLHDRQEELEVVSMRETNQEIFIVLKQKSGEIVNEKVKALGRTTDIKDMSSKFARFEDTDEDE